MSKVSPYTEKEVITRLGKSLRQLEFAGLNMSGADNTKIQQAEELIRSVIISNGYQITYLVGKGTKIKKIPDPIANHPKGSN